MLRARIDAGERPSVAWRTSPNDLLLDVLMMEGLFAEAWVIVRTHGCHEGLLESLAEASEESHPAEALKAHARRIERLVDGAGNANYRAACELVERMRVIREGLDEEVEHDAYVGELTSRYKAKRNFMKLLRERGLAGERVAGRLQ